jgi:hypothetical protein
MFSKRSIILFALISTIFCISCGNKEESVVPAGPLWKPSGNEGNITGVIAFNGDAPAPRRMEMSQDSACEKMGETFFNDVIVIDGKGNGTSRSWRARGRSRASSRKKRP